MTFEEGRYLNHTIWEFQFALIYGYSLVPIWLTISVIFAGALWEMKNEYIHLRQKVVA